MAEEPKKEEDTKAAATPVADMSLLSITDGENARGIPFIKFIEDVDGFANTFTPPASAELMIGAYSELHSKFKTFETSLTQKSKSLKQKMQIFFLWGTLYLTLVLHFVCVCVRVFVCILSYFDRAKLSSKDPRYRKITFFDKESTQPLLNKNN